VTGDGAGKDGLPRWLATLLTPAAGFRGGAGREQAVILSCLLLFGLCWISVAALLVRFVLAPEVGWRNPTIVIALASLLALAVAFGLNRRGHYLIAAMMAVLTLVTAVLLRTEAMLAVLSSPQYAADAVYVLSYLLLPLIVGAVLLPLRLLAVTIALAAVGVRLVALNHPLVTWMELFRGPLQFVLTAGVLLLVASYAAGIIYRRRLRMMEWREGRYCALFEQSPDAILLVSVDGVVQTINAAGLSLFAHSRADIEGGFVWQLFAVPGDAAILSAALAAAGVLVEQPVRMLTRDGVVLDCLVDIRKVSNPVDRWEGYQMVVRDVTARLKQDEELRLKGQLLDFAIDVVFLVEPGGEIVYANEAGARLTGYRLAELMGMNIRQLNTPDGAEQVPHRIGELMRLGEYVFEAVWLHRNGTQVSVEVHGRTVQSRGRTLILSVAHDITRRKSDEAELRLRSELLDLAGDAVLLHDHCGRLLYANQTATQQTGYSREELLSMSMGDLDELQTPDLLRVRMVELMNRRIIAYEGTYRRMDGVVIPVDVRARIVGWDDRAIVLVIARDISERKRVESELRSSEERFRALFEQSLDAIWVLRADGTGHQVNQAWLDIFGYTREDLLTLHAGDLYVDPAARDTFLSRIAEAGIVRDDVRFRKKDGTEFTCERIVVAHRDEHGRIVTFQAVCRDVTAIRSAEERLRLSEERYRSLFELLLDGVYINRPDGTTIEANQALLDLFGYTREELGQVTAADMYADRADRKAFLEQMAEYGAVADEVRYKRKDGTTFDGQRAVVVRKDSCGHVVAFQGVIRDITERKAAERRLRESEQRYRTLFERSLDGISIIALDGTLLDANPAYLSLFGYSAADIGRLNVRTHYVNPADRDEYVQRLEHEGVVIDHHARLIKMDGSVMDCIRSSVVHRDDAGRVVYIQTVIRDVTEWYRAQAELRRSEERYRSLFEQSMDAVALVSLDGTLESANAAYLRMFGCTPSDIGKRLVWSHYLNPEEREEMLRLVERDGAVLDQEVRQRRADGTQIDCLRTVLARRDNEGRLVGVQSVTRDITARKRSEQELRDSETRFRALVERTGFGTAISLLDGTILECNETLPRMLGYTQEEFLTLRVPDTMADGHEMESLRARVIEDGFLRDAEVTFRRKDGTPAYFSVTAAHVPMDGRTVVVSQFLDVTERREAQLELVRSREALRQSLDDLHELASYLEEARERERIGIARELHDQLGQALTALRMDLDAVRRAAAAGQTISNERLARMEALLSETVNDVRRISSELRPGILDDAGLVAAIEWQLDRFQERAGIDCRFESQADATGLDRASTTALFRVFQELLTNVARHANASSVLVTFERTDAGHELCVCDDGRGITAVQSRSASALGIVGMRERLRPLHGTLEYERRRPKGTTARVRLPLATDSTPQ